MKEVEELRGAVATLTALVTALVETHPNPEEVQKRFVALTEQLMAEMLARNTDESTNVAEAACDAMMKWLDDLAWKRRLEAREMKERRIARHCRNCGESMPNDALLCAKCGKSTGEIYTRLTDPNAFAAATLRPATGGRQ